MKRTIIFALALSSYISFAEYSVEWHWDMEPPRRVSAGQSFKIAGHWTVAYSSSSGSIHKRLSAIWKIRSGSGQKLSGGTFVANTSLTLWGSATSPSTEVPDLSKIVTISVNSSSSGSGGNQVVATPSGSQLNSTEYCPSPVILQSALDSLPMSAVSNRIESVIAKTRYPWSGLVDVVCTITGEVEVADARIQLSGVGDGIELPLNSVSGDRCAAAGERRFVWDAKKDLNGSGVSNAKITASIIRGSPAYDILSKKPKYIVIDLSGGTNACYYPMSELSEIPTGGWSDEYKTSKLVLRRVEPGSFIMGSATSYSTGTTINRLSDVSKNEDAHTVVLTKPFYLGVFEMTQKQWKLVSGTRPSYFTNLTDYATRPVEALTYNVIRGSTEGNKWPQSSAVDRNSFLGVFRSKTGIAEFDLPTEAQWEYACRAGTTEAQYVKDEGMWRNYWVSTCGRSNYGSDNRNVSAESGGTAVVGSYTPNPWGFYDMYGNAAELVRDWYQKSLGFACVTNPVGPSPGSKTGDFHVSRGGCWLNSGGSSEVRRTDFVVRFRSCARYSEWEGMYSANPGVYEYPLACGFRISLDVEE